MKVGLGLLFFAFIGLLMPLPIAAQQNTAPQMPAAPPLATGQPPQRDPRALSVATQTLNGAGGVATLSGIEDFTGTGTITYYWAGEEVKGSVTVKGRGTGQFRLDANLPEGVRSWSVSDGDGMTKEANGQKTPIEYHNGVDFGSLTFPLILLAADLQDPTVSISYVGLETQNGSQVHHIHTQKVFDNDQAAILGWLSRKDFFIDASTFQVVSTLDMLHPKNQADVDRPHEMRFSDYRSVNGISVPFSITEIVIGQQTFTLQLGQITFNGNLNDTDFDIQ